MNRYSFVYLVCMAMAGATLSNVAADDDEEKPQGEWLLASIEVHGKSLPAPVGKGGSIVFDKDGKLILKDPGKPDKIGKYKIDASKDPKQIDLIVSKDEKGKDGVTMQGIYEFDGDKLKMAFSAENPKEKRPSDFKGEKVLIVLWKRQKS
ncbi:MAG TPA: TIGR03067 domain-containing protein [Gemmataceae bacterium]|nr:TIGR03067 domain-containing protein [Gemmataceae bacterium]